MNQARVLRRIAAGGGTAAALGGVAGALWWRRRAAAADADPNLNLAGAPMSLSPSPRSSQGATVAVRVAAPDWEPQMLTWLAQWQPAAPRTALGRTLAYAWASPMTLVGLAVGLAAGTRPVLREGVVLFSHAKGVTGPVLRRRGFDAGTFGHVVVARGEPGERLLAHELLHTRQAERLGPFLAPVYLGLLAVYGYARHPLERSAARGARIAVGIEPPVTADRR